MTWKDYELDELAFLFPAMSPEEFEALKGSIGLNGFDPIEPITLWQGRVVDGRHRLMACRELGVEPAVHCLADDADAEGYVLRKNGGARRHLTTGQRGLIGARMAAGSKRGGDRQSKHSAKLRNGLTQGQVAEAMAVSVRLVSQGAAVLKAFEGVADDVVRAVEAGALSLNEAYGLRGTPIDLLQEAVKEAGGNPGELKRILLADEPMDKEVLFAAQWGQADYPLPVFWDGDLQWEYIHWLDMKLTAEGSVFDPEFPCIILPPYCLVLLMDSAVKTASQAAIVDRWFYDLCWGFDDDPEVVFAGNSGRLAGFADYVEQGGQKMARGALGGGKFRGWEDTGAKGINFFAVPPQGAMALTAALMGKEELKVAKSRDMERVAELEKRRREKAAAEANKTDEERIEEWHRWLQGDNARGAPRRGVPNPPPGE